MTTAFRFLILFTITAILLVGCNRGEVSGVQRAPEGGVDATITLSEADINEVVASALAARPNPLLRNPQIDLQPGVLVISGEHDRRDGGGTVSGSLTAAVTLVDGRISVQVTAVDIEGLALGDDLIAQFNQGLSDALDGRLNRDNPVATIKSLTISDTSLEVVVNLQR
jgi:hypothetical protein